MKLVKKIDIHVHTSESKWLARLPEGRYATPEEIMDLYDKIGVEKGVLLPEIGIEGGFHTNSNYEIKTIADKYPHRFSWFCNIDARQGDNSPNTDFTPYINFCKKNGAKGVGEIVTNLYFDDPLMLNLFSHCEKCNMPIIFHMGNKGGDYGIVDDTGLPRLEKVLQMFPNLKFLGHSPKFWVELHDNDMSNSRLIELMRKYPNLCGDLSAYSGYNAVTRIPELGYSFLEEFQDRLYYGTDISDPNNEQSPMLKLSAFLDDAVINGKISYEAYIKVSRKNALALLE